MSLREGTRFRERHVTFFSNYGGLGDNLARLPAVKWIKDTQPHVRLTVYWYDFFLPLARHFVPETQMIRHLPFNEMVYCDERIPMVDFYPDQVNSLSIGLLEHAFLMWTQRPPQPGYDTYIKHVKDTSGRYSFLDALGDYVVVTPCYTSATRAWPESEVNKFMHGCRDLGLKTVLVGRTDEIPLGNKFGIKTKVSDLDMSLVDMNLINRGDIFMALEVIARAKAVVGVDNGLLHLSATTYTPSVWGFTTVEPVLRLPKGIRYEAVIPKGCRFCQSSSYLVEQDFRECMYKDYACTKEMTGDTFLGALKKLLDIPTM